MQYFKSAAFLLTMMSSLVSLLAEAKGAAAQENVAVPEVSVTEVPTARDTEEETSILPFMRLFNRKEHGLVSQERLATLTSVIPQDFPERLTAIAPVMKTEKSPHFAAQVAQTPVSVLQPLSLNDVQNWAETAIAVDVDDISLAFASSSSLLPSPVQQVSDSTMGDLASERLAQNSDDRPDGSNLPRLEETETARPNSADDRPLAAETDTGTPDTRLALAAEIDRLPESLLADPNPLSFPTSPAEVEIDRSPVITLEQAVDLAYRNNQTLQSSLLSLEQAQAAVREARAAQRPTVSTRTSLTTSGAVERDAPTSTGFQSLVRLDYDLLTSGGRVASIRAAELQEQVSELAVEVQQEEIRLVVSNLYYALQEAGENIRINKSFLEEAERNLRDTQLRQDVGVGTRFDTLRAEVQFADARQAVIQSESQQRIARRQLAQILNLPTKASIETTSVAVADSWPLTLEESIVLAFQNRAELEQQLLSSDISEQQRRIALAAIRPQVGVFAQYQLADTFDDGNSPSDSYALGIEFNMTLSDGGAARASARQQEIAGEIAEASFSGDLDQVRFDVEESYFDLQANQENITTAEVAVAQATEALELANLRLQAGVGTQLDVLTAQSELTEAEANRVTAILGYNRALAALERAVSNVRSVLLF